MGETGKHFWRIFLNIMIVVITFVLIIWGVPRLLVFFMPFVVGAVIALLASPIVRVLEDHMKVHRKTGSMFTIIVVVGLVALVLYGIGNILVQQAIGFIENLPQMWETFESEISEIAVKFQVIYDRMPQQTQQQWNQVGANIQEYVGDLIGRLSSPTMEKVGNIAKNVPNILISIIMALLSAYFFVADKAWISRCWHAYVPQPVRHWWTIIRDSLKKAFGGYLLAQLKIELWMYLLLVVGLTIAGTGYVLLVAFGIAFLDLLPVFGTGTVLIPWAVIKLLGGNYKTAVILLVLWGVGQLLRQFIQPHYVGNSLGLPSIPTLILLYAGWKIGGVWGMILAVPVGLMFLNLYKAGAFQTAKDSIIILSRDISAFCKYKNEDFEFYRHFEDEEKRQ